MPRDSNDFPTPDVRAKPIDRGAINYNGQGAWPMTRAVSMTKGEAAPGKIRKIVRTPYSARALVQRKSRGAPDAEAETAIARNEKGNADGR